MSASFLARRGLTFADIDGVSLSSTVPAMVPLLRDLVARYLRPGCPLVDQLRTLLNDCIRRSGMRPVVETVSGSYPSPTMLINGIDVATGRPPTDQVCCRLDLPTSEQIVTALQKGGR